MSRISAVIPSYGHADHIEGALLAILSQSRPPDELIVVDDASVDGSAAKVERLAEDHPQLRQLYNPTNLGPVYALLRGVEATSGDFLYLGSADDRVLPGLFEKSLAALERHPEAGLCCSQPCDFEGELPSEWPPAQMAPECLSQSHYRQWPIFISGTSSVIRRSAFEQAGKLHPELRWSCDWFMTQVIAHRHGICYLPEPLAAQRLGVSDSYSSRRHRSPTEQARIHARAMELLSQPEYADVRDLNLRHLHP